MKRSLIAISSIILVTVSFGSAHAMNYTGSIFAGAQIHADSNSYKNANYSFSIQPPVNWSILNLPPSISQGTIVTFSNEDKSQLATFSIYHRFIAPNVIQALDSHADNDILATVAQEMSINSSDSRTVVFNGVVDRYNDGVKVSIGSATHYTTDNSTSISENIIYYLNNGSQYTLDMTSKPDTFDKNSQLFEDAASTFLATQTNAVPEFPFAILALIVAMVSIIIISRTRLPVRL